VDISAAVSPHHDFAVIFEMVLMAEILSAPLASARASRRPAAASEKQRSARVKRI
jgi:hypothetical protein